MVNYPCVETRVKFALQYATDCPKYIVLRNGKIKEVPRSVSERDKRKWWTPEQEPSMFGKTLVDCGFLQQMSGKGSPWRFVKHYFCQGTRVYPYLSENIITTEKLP
jgi:hypothetical protein